MALGVSDEEFWKLNPRKIKVLLNGYHLKRQIEDEKLWMLGEYVFDAASIALGNAFKKKGQKSKEYFELVKEPITKRISQAKDENNLTDAEKKAMTERFFRNLEIMAANHRISKGK